MLEARPARQHGQEMLPGVARRGLAGHAGPGRDERVAPQAEAAKMMDLRELAQIRAALQRLKAGMNEAGPRRGEEMPEAKEAAAPHHAGVDARAAGARAQWRYLDLCDLFENVPV